MSRVFPHTEPFAAADDTVSPSGAVRNGAMSCFPSPSCVLILSLVPQGARSLCDFHTARFTASPNRERQIYPLYVFRFFLLFFLFSDLVFRLIVSSFFYFFFLRGVAEGVCKSGLKGGGR